MAVIKCKMCGGDLDIAGSSTVATCEYCGTQQTIPTVDNEKKLTLFSRANRLRLACEFDKAATVYESIVAEFPTEAEAYWGLVLCRYGIEYVDDPATGKKIPTCHRSSFDSIFEDSDFEQAQENADVIARKIYRNEAKAIENLRRGILEVSSKEEPYDIFICYKEAAEDGQRTLDSVIAQDVYDVLTEKGYRVFFSRITLEDKLGTEYEPYIFAALNSAKVMLVFGTDYEYFNAVWVKNEWSRFLALISAGQKKTLIPCYKGVDAYDMPKEFSKLQAQDMGKVGALQDLLRGINKIINGSSTSIAAPASLEQQIQAQEQTKADNTVQLGTMALNSGDLQRAVQYYEEALKIDSNHIGAYLGLVRALDSQKSCPYCNRLESASADAISQYLKQNPEMLDRHPVSLLNKAVLSIQSLAVIKAIIEAGMNPNDDYVLYNAVISERSNKYELVKLLMDNGADPNKEYQLKFNNTVEVCTPLRDVIWQAKDVELANLLISYGADVNYVSKSSNKLSWSLLNMAVRTNSYPMVQLLLDHGADANSVRLYQEPSCEGYGTPTAFPNLADAIWTARNAKIVHCLLEHNANPNVTYKVFSKTYDYVENKVRSPLIDTILFSDDVEILQVLLNAGADPVIKYEESRKFWDPEERLSNYERKISALDLAIKNKKDDMVLVLTEAVGNFDRISQIDLLKAERESLQAEISTLTGLFANIRRKGIEKRLEEISKELNELEDTDG